MPARQAAVRSQGAVRHGGRSARAGHQMTRPVADMKPARASAKSGRKRVRRIKKAGFPGQKPVNLPRFGPAAHSGAVYRDNKTRRQTGRPRTSSRPVAVRDPRRSRAPHRPTPAIAPEPVGALRVEKERPFTLNAAAIRSPRRRARGSRAGSQPRSLAALMHEVALIEPARYDRQITDGDRSRLS